jgi:hypothetical protein
MVGLRTAAAPLLLLPAAIAVAQTAGEWRNVTVGGSLRHGAYGRIEVRGSPPPLINAVPVVASQPIGAPVARPVYLYVPPGQVRKWEQHCAKWRACDLPVLFVRMDNSPSRLGHWKQRAQRAGATRQLLAGPASQSSPR